MIAPRENGVDPRIGMVDLVKAGCLSIMVELDRNVWDGQ